MKPKGKNIIWQPHPGSQEYYLSCPADEALISGNRGGGKAQPLSSTVHTPYGPRAMGEIKVDSEVLNPDGTTSRVIGVFPQGVQPVYRILFDDGTDTMCTADHLWFGKFSDNHGAAYTPLDFNGTIRTTKQLIQGIDAGNTFMIPCTDPVHYVNSTKYNFDPYLLGLMLGDGDRGTFIPKKCMQGTKLDRLALLQGIMAKGGKVKKDKIKYSSTSYQLVRGVQNLVQGFGGTAKMKGSHGRKWKLVIRFPEPLDLFRKLEDREKVRRIERTGRLVRKIVSIDYVTDERCQCIKVDNPNGLYLTDNFIVTHNTDVLLMDFLQDVGVGHGSEWRGILFREEYTQLTDIINKSRKWISQIFPGAKYNGSEHKWTFPEGEQLYLRYMRVPSDYWNYHGHEYPWIGFEELTNWATDECYKIMMSCNRSSNPTVPRKYRATCNPSGPGHSWVKQRFIDNAKPLQIYRDEETGKTRVNIPSSLSENVALLTADPDYEKTILAAAQDDPIKYKAWVLGEWDIIAGGALSDVWLPKNQTLPHFELPKSWTIHRSFDWGSTKPWSVTYGAECNGEQPDREYNIPYLPKGTVIIIDEIYGWTGKVNEGDQAVSQEIAERTIAKDRALELEYGCRVYSGPADTSIYEVRDGSSIGSNMATHGCHWKRAYKGSGSRVAGLALIRQMLAASKRQDIEKPGLYFFDRARHHLRTFPILQYDPKKSEDIDTSLEDHAYDSTRYLLTRKFTKMGRRKVKH